MLENIKNKTHQKSYFFILVKNIYKCYACLFFKNSNQTPKNYKLWK